MSSPENGTDGPDSADSADGTDSTAVPIRSAPIRLGQFLKLAGLAEDGGHAKELLESGEVTVNGRVEGRRGAQLDSGDVVAVSGVRARPLVAGQ